MCEHPDHEVVTLPDGQFAETHVFDAEQMAEMVKDMLRRDPITFVSSHESTPYDDLTMMLRVERMLWATTTAAAAHSFPMTIGAS